MSVVVRVGGDLRLQETERKDERGTVDGWGMGYRRGPRGGYVDELVVVGFSLPTGKHRTSVGE